MLSFVSTHFDSSESLLLGVNFRHQTIIDRSCLINLLIPFSFSIFHMDVHPHTHVDKLTLLMESDSSLPSTPYPDHYSALSWSSHHRLQKKVGTKCTTKSDSACSGCLKQCILFSQNLTKIIRRVKTCLTSHKTKHHWIQICAKLKMTFWRFAINDQFESMEFVYNVCLHLSKNNNNNKTIVQ